MPFFDIFASKRWSPLRMRTKVVSFFIFFRELWNKKNKALRPKMTKIASRGFLPQKAIFVKSPISSPIVPIAERSWKPYASYLHAAFVRRYDAYFSHTEATAPAHHRTAHIHALTIQCHFSLPTSPSPSLKVYFSLCLCNICWLLLFLLTFSSSFSFDLSHERIF